MTAFAMFLQRIKAMLAQPDASSRGPANAFPPGVYQAIKRSALSATPR